MLNISTQDLRHTAIEYLEQNPPQRLQSTLAILLVRGLLSCFTRTHSRCAVDGFTVAGDWRPTLLKVRCGTTEVKVKLHINVLEMGL